MRDQLGFGCFLYESVECSTEQANEFERFPVHALKGGRLHRCLKESS